MLHYRLRPSALNNLVMGAACPYGFVLSGKNISPLTGLEEGLHFKIPDSSAIYCAEVDRLFLPFSFSPFPPPDLPLFY